MATASRPDVDEIMANVTADELRRAIALAAATATPSPPERPASARNFAGPGFIFGAGGSATGRGAAPPARTATEQVAILSSAIAKEQNISENAARCQVLR